MGSSECAREVLRQQIMLQQTEDWTWKKGRTQASGSNIKVYRLKVEGLRTQSSNRRCGYSELVNIPTHTCPLLTKRHPEEFGLG